jgi:hypothetical protein
MPGRGQNWQWEHFYKPGNKYRNDKTHFAAKCNYCVRGHLEAVTKEAQDERVRDEVMPSKQELLDKGTWQWMENPHLIHPFY